MSSKRKFSSLADYKIKYLRFIQNNKVVVLICHNITGEQYITIIDDYSNLSNNSYNKLDLSRLTKVDALVESFQPAFNKKENILMVSNLINYNHNIKFGIAKNDTTNISKGEFGLLKSCIKQIAVLVFNAGEVKEITMGEIYGQRFIEDDNLVEIDTVIAKEIKNTDFIDNKAIFVTSFNKTAKYSDRSTPIAQLTIIEKYQNGTYKPVRSQGIEGNRLGPYAINLEKFLTKSQATADQSSNDIPITSKSEIKIINNLEIVFNKSKNSNNGPNFHMISVGENEKGETIVIITRSAFFIQNNKISIQCDLPKKCLTSWNNEVKKLFGEVILSKITLQVKDSRWVGLSAITQKNSQINLEKRIFDIYSPNLSNENNKYPSQPAQSFTYNISFYTGESNISIAPIDTDDLQITCSNGDIYNCNFNSNLYNCTFKLNFINDPSTLIDKTTDFTTNNNINSTVKITTSDNINPTSINNTEPTKTSDMNSSVPSTKSSTSTSTKTSKIITSNTNNPIKTETHSIKPNTTKPFSTRTSRGGGTIIGPTNTKTSAILPTLITAGLTLVNTTRLTTKTINTTTSSISHDKRENNNANLAWLTIIPLAFMAGFIFYWFYNKRYSKKQIKPNAYCKRKKGEELSEEIKFHNINTINEKDDNNREYVLFDKNTIEFTLKSNQLAVQAKDKNFSSTSFIIDKKSPKEGSSKKLT